MEADEYYSSISKSYENLYGEEQRKKINAVIRILQISPRDSILDIGAGDGILERTLLNNDIVAIEPSSLCLSIPVSENITVERKKISQFETNRRFDVVVCITVLQDLKDGEKKICVDKAFAYCKVGGRIAISALRVSGIDLGYLKPAITTDVENDRLYIFYKTEKV